MSATSDISHAPARPDRADAATLAASLFARHHRRIYRHCLHRLRSTHDAEDALQQTFANALKALTAGSRPRQELAWLLRIAQNICLEKTRNAARRAQLEALHGPDSLAELATSRAPLRDDRLDLLGAALSRLDGRQREALVLREWRGLSLQEIASVMQLTQSAVEALLFRARRSFARILADSRRLRGALDLGGLAGTIRTLLNSAGGKTAAITACCGLTLIAVPTLDHTLRHHPTPQPTARTTHHAATGQLTKAPHVSAGTRTQAQATDSWHVPPARSATPPGQTAPPSADTLAGPVTAGQSIRRLAPAPPTHPYAQLSPGPQTGTEAPPRTAAIALTATTGDTSLQSNLGAAGTTLDASLSLGDGQQAGAASAAGAGVQSETGAVGVDATVFFSVPTAQTSPGDSTATTSTTDTSSATTAAAADASPTGVLQTRLTH